jgi:F-type H+-transporting ATPase subunit gamma
MEEYLDERCGAVEIVYMQFVSSSQQRPAVAQLLPLSYLEPSAAATRESSGRGYEFLPDRRRILRQLLPASVRVRVYQCFLDAAVSEQITRMQAMRSASENADKMIRELTTRYNRQRQAQITNELAEIMGGSESMQR